MEAGKVDAGQAPRMQGGVVIQQPLLDRSYAHREIRLYGIFLGHPRIRVNSGGKVDRHRAHGSAAVPQVVHFRAEGGDFLAEQPFCSNAQQAVQQNHGLARTGQRRFLVFLGRRRYFRELPHGQFPPFRARVGGAETCFPAMLFQDIEDGEGVSAVVAFPHVGYA